MSKTLKEKLDILFQRNPKLCPYLVNEYWLNNHTNPDMDYTNKRVEFLVSIENNEIQKIEVANMLYSELPLFLARRDVIDIEYSPIGKILYD